MSSSWTQPAISPAYLAESRVASYLAGCTTPWIIATIFMLARLYSRAVILRTWGWDDTFLLSAWVGSVIVFAIDLAMIPTGIGKHVQTTTLQDGVNLLKYAYAVKIIYTLTLGLTKLAIARFYLRIFTDRLSRHVIWGIITWIATTTIALVFIMIFRCTPISDAWKLQQANCPVDGTVIVSINGVANILGDVALISFVLPKIYKLKMHARQKAILLAIVLTSTLVVIAACIRLAQTVHTIDSFDQTWVQADIGVWSVVEINVGIFAASILAIKPLISRVYPKLLSSLPYSSSPSGGSGSSGSRGGASSSGKAGLSGASASLPSRSRGKKHPYDTLDTQTNTSFDMDTSREHMAAKSGNVYVNSTLASSDAGSLDSQLGIVRTTDVYHAHEPYEMELERKEGHDAV